MREEEIEKFIPEEYWSLTASLESANSKKAFEAKFYGTNKEKISLAKGYGNLNISV